MNDVQVEPLQPSNAASTGTEAVDIWSRSFVQDFVMDGLTPAEPFIDPNSSVIACGSGFSAMLRRREFARHAQVLSAKRFGAALPMVDAQPVAVADVLGILEKILRGRSGESVGAAQEAEQLRRRIKRTIQHATAVALTFGTTGRADATAAEVHRDLKTISRLLQRFAPEARLILAIDPTPVLASAGAAPNLTASAAIKATLRAAVQQLLITQAADLNQRLFYFPAYELTQDFSHVAQPPSAILHIFRAYYTSAGPILADAENGYRAGRLKVIAAVRKAAGAGRAPAQEAKPL